MVKKGTVLGPRNPVTKRGAPRLKPGRKIPPSDLRAERLVLRVHPDLQSILNVRSREKGLSRSQYVERIILGWVRSDPRNPALDMIGKRVSSAVEPAVLKETSPLKFGQLWARFEQVSELILEEAPRKIWFEDDLPPDFFAAADAEARRLLEDDPSPAGAAEGDEPAEE
jgi:hypothetical protein